MWALRCSGSLAFLLEADDKREMTRDMGETFFWWSEQADQATPMGRAELRAKTGTSRRREWTAALTRRGPTVSIPTGPGLLKSSLASLVTWDE